MEELRAEITKQLERVKSGEDTIENLVEDVIEVFLKNGWNKDFSKK